MLSQWNGIKVKLRPWLTTIVAIWCCGVLVFSLRPLWGWLMVRRLLRVGTKPVSLHVQQALQRVREKMQVGRHVEVFASSLIGSPIVVGCFRSVILVPASFVTNLPMVQLEAILAHELAHVQRYDYLVNLLQTLVETLLFYHRLYGGSLIASAWNGKIAVMIGLWRCSAIKQSTVEPSWR